MALPHDHVPPGAVPWLCSGTHLCPQSTGYVGAPTRPTARRCSVLCSSGLGVSSFLPAQTGAGGSGEGPVVFLVSQFWPSPVPAIVDITEQTGACSQKRSRLKNHHHKDQAGLPRGWPDLPRPWYHTGGPRGRGLGVTAHCPCSSCHSTGPGSDSPSDLAPRTRRAPALCTRFLFGGWASALLVIPAWPRGRRHRSHS